MSSTMADPYNKFCRQFFGFAGIYPNAMAGIQLGAYGHWKNGLFSAVGTLQSTCGIDLSSQISPAVTLDNLQAQSKTMNEARSSTTASGNSGDGTGNQAGGTATVEYSASEANSFAVTLTSVSSQTIADVDTVLRNAASQLKGKHWDPSYRIVVGLWTATSYFMFGTKSKSSSLRVAGTVSAVNTFMSGTVNTELNKTGSTDGSLEVLEANEPMLVGFTLASIDQLSPVKLGYPNDSYSS